jgi:tetratricopeptide (TPR) repeat protein
MKERIDKARIIELAERQVKAGRIEDAIAEYKKLLAGESPDLSINNIIGDLYVQLGRNEQAVKAFQAAAGHYETKGYHSQALALYKKITKIDPENVVTIVRLGDLFISQGFIAEAKREFLRAEQKFRREKRTKELMYLYDKLVKLEKDNVSFKLTLADLYRQEGFIEDAVILFNEAAELHLSRNESAEAEKIIQQAHLLKADEERTVSNLIEVLRKTNRRKYALELVNDILQRDKSNSRFQILLGTLYLDDRELEKAEAIFSRIITEHPLETRARIKLGKIYALQNRPEKAFELFGPLIAGLLKKQKEDKAIGLLGIVLSADRLYLPALDKLAALYKSKNELDSFEIVCRVILDEARARNLNEKMFIVLAELLELHPKDENLVREYRELKKQLGFLDEKTDEVDLRAASEAEEKDIDLLLAKVDLYISQGLIRNARRILENLSIRFPHSAKIEEKIAALGRVKTEIRADEISTRVSKIQEIETKIDAAPELAKTFLSQMQDEGGAEKRVTSADIFAETEILPLPTEEAAEKKFYDLTGKIEEELGLIRNVFAQQIRGDISILEKDLTEIVRDFRDHVHRKIDSKDYETRFHLGLAYLEQGLIEEAIEEFLLASEDPGRTLECFSIISKAFKQKGDLNEAVKWLSESLKKAGPGTPEFYALEYEQALLHEDRGDKVRALELYRRIKHWNPDYRDVKQKVKGLA